MSNLPLTDILKRTIKHMIIHHSNPAELSDDPIEGLEEQRRELAMITDDFLLENVEDYKAVEEEIASTVGEKFIGYFIEESVPTDGDISSPPDVLVSEFYDNVGSSSSSGVPIINIVHGETYFIMITLSGGTTGLDYTYDWVTQTKPDGSNIIIEEISDESDPGLRILTYSFVFDIAGTYTFDLILTNPTNTDMQVVERISKTVE